MAEMWISMGPQHPMTHGLWTLKIKVDRETVVDTEPDLGYIHRGVEKICESRDFTQITTYTNIYYKLHTKHNLILIYTTDFQLITSYTNIYYKH